VTSNFEVDVNCPYCFDDIVAALRNHPTVTEVHASIGAGCVSVTHDTDEAHLANVITDIGHRVIVAGNGEIVQDQLHARQTCSCRVHR
jgi:copper chaperone CopZ